MKPLADMVQIRIHEASNLLEITSVDSPEDTIKSAEYIAKDDYTNVLWKFLAEGWKGVWDDVSEITSKGVNSIFQVRDILCVCQCYVSDIIDYK